MKRCLVTAALALVLPACSSVTGITDYNQQTVGSLSPVQMPPAQPSHAKKDRAAAMKQYQAFLEESPDSKFAPEAMRRLADLNLQAEQEALAAGKTPSGESRAAKLYAELIKRFPDNPGNDSALYELARARELSGEAEPAMAALSSYTRKFPDGAHYDEAQFRRGEYLFVRRNYRGAEQAYQAVLDLGPSGFHQQALYKIGWARFKQGHYEAALNAFMTLLDETIGSIDTAELPDNLRRTDRERIDDTLRAISLSFSYLGPNTEIRDYFAKHGSRRYEPLIYARLAALHLGKERFSDAAEVYGLFATVHPQHRESPLFQSRVIDVYKKAGFSERVLAEKEAYIRRYEPGSDYWKHRDPKDVPYVLSQVQRHLRDVARHYHAVALARKTPAAYAEAGRWYQLFLRAFPNSEQTPYMNFLYAELLTSAGQHGLAAAQYERTAYDYGHHDKAAEAGYAALLAYEKHEASLSGAAKADWHRAGIASALRFSDTFPEHKEALPARTRAAQQLYALHEYAAAIAAARPIVENARAPAALQLSAWTVIAHAEFDQAHYADAETAYHQVLARVPPADKTRQAVQEKLAASIYEQGAQKKAAGDLAGAAADFLRISEVVPGSKVNETARYDAAAAYIALKRWPDAIGILERWRRDYPGNPLQGDVTRKLAVLYRDNNEPLKAAGEFRRLADTDKDPKLRREAALTTATLYRDAGHKPEAIAAYKAFVERYPHPVEAAMEARYQLVELYGASGQVGEQRYWQEQLVEADRTAGAERTDRTRYLAAHARLALVAVDERAYREVQLKEPLKKNLGRKKKYMKAAIKGYDEAAGYEVAEVTTEAAYRIGEIYADFSRALMASERPHNLRGEELEQYNILLEEQAYPFEEKAISVHETNAGRISTGLYDSWVRKSMEKLAKLLPARYAKPEKGENFVSVMQ